MKFQNCILIFHVQKITSLLMKCIYRSFANAFYTPGSYNIQCKEQVTCLKNFYYFKIFTHTNPSEKLQLQEGKLLRNSVGLYPACRKYALLSITQAIYPQALALLHHTMK